MGEHLLCKQGVGGSIPSTSRFGCVWLVVEVLAWMVAGWSAALLWVRHVWAGLLPLGGAWAERAGCLVFGNCESGSGVLLGTQDGSVLLLWRGLWTVPWRRGGASVTAFAWVSDPCWLVFLAFWAGEIGWRTQAALQGSGVLLEVYVLSEQVRLCGWDGGLGLGGLFEGLPVSWAGCSCARWDLLEQEKGIRWMPWHQEAMKDVARCEKPWGAASRL